MNEVYEVCQRLKAAGFPQAEQCLQFFVVVTLMAGEDARRKWTSSAECPNASECMKFAREQWPDGAVSLHGIATAQHRPPRYIVAFTGPPHGYAEDTDPDQAARLVLAAALEAAQ